MLRVGIGKFCVIVDGKLCERHLGRNAVVRPFACRLRLASL
jgi:hypothetical protein